MEPASQKSHANKVGQAAGPRLCHDIRTIDLDGPGADPEVKSNDLVGLSSN
jgi:hypothetical protein